jgi:type VI secretion system secreted protein Hcp
MAGYIKLGEIKGESTEPNHKEWINLLSVSQGVSRGMPSGASGSTRKRGAATLGDIVIVKELDKSTPKLVEAICKGTQFPTVTIHLTTSAEGDTRTPYMAWELKNAMVTDYSVSGATEGGSVPTESLSINYEEVKWTYDEIDKDNKSKGKVETSWKTEEGTA